MGLQDAKSAHKKRKHAQDDAVELSNSLQDVSLEMLSEEEDLQEDEEDDGEADEFPGIDTKSDSEDEDEGFSDEDEPDEEEEDTASSVDDQELHIFPKGKTIISNITGQPKTVYPEIEPEYDSDSSTEDVRQLPNYPRDFP